MLAARSCATCPDPQALNVVSEDKKGQVGHNSGTCCAGSPSVSPKATSPSRGGGNPLGSHVVSTMTTGMGPWERALHSQGRGVTNPSRLSQWVAI